MRQQFSITNVVRIKAVNKGYPSLGHCFCKLMTFRMWPDPVSVVPAGVEVVIEYEAYFSIVRGINRCIRGYER